LVAILVILSLVFNGLAGWSRRPKQLFELLTQEAACGSGYIRASQPKERLELADDRLRAGLQARSQAFLPPYETEQT